MSILKKNPLPMSVSVIQELEFLPGIFPAFLTGFIVLIRPVPGNRAGQAWAFLSPGKLSIHVVAKYFWKVSRKKGQRLRFHYR